MTRLSPTAKHMAVILLVEDDDDQAFLTIEAFRSAKVRVDIRHVTDGQQALQFLRREPPFENAPRPDIVLLDIRLPRMDGYAVMEALNSDPALRSLVVIVLTTSSHHLDVERMYRLGCRSYITKPVDFTEFQDVLSRLADYWLELVVLPARDAAPAEPSGQAGKQVP